MVEIKLIIYQLISVIDFMINNNYFKIILFVFIFHYIALNTRLLKVTKKLYKLGSLKNSKYGSISERQKEIDNEPISIFVLFFKLIVKEIHTFHSDEDNVEDLISFRHVNNKHKETISVKEKIN